MHKLGKQCIVVKQLSDCAIALGFPMKCLQHLCGFRFLWNKFKEVESVRVAVQKEDGSIDRWTSPRLMHFKSVCLHADEKLVYLLMLS